MVFFSDKIGKAAEWNLFAVASVQISKNDYVCTSTAWLSSIYVRDLKIQGEKVEFLAYWGK